MTERSLGSSPAPKVLRVNRDLEVVLCSASSRLMELTGLFESPFRLEELSSLAKLTGIHYSQQRQCLYVCTSTHLYAFENQHGTRGIAHIIAGAKKLAPGEVDDLGTMDLKITDEVTITEDPSGALLLPEPSKSVLHRIDLQKQQHEDLRGGAKAFAKNHHHIILKPTCALYDHHGDLIIVDNGKHRILSYRDTTMSVIAGKDRKRGFKDGLADISILDRPHSAVSLPHLGLLFTDSGNNRIRRVSGDGIVSTVAGTGVRGTVDGSVFSATFAEPTSIQANAIGDLIVLEGSTFRLRFIHNGNVSTLYKPRMPNAQNPPQMTGMSVGPTGEIYLASKHGLFCYYPSRQNREIWSDSQMPSLQLTFEQCVSWEALSASSISKTSESSAMAMVTIDPKPQDNVEDARRGSFILPLPTLNRNYYIPRALIRTRCPALLEPQNLAVLHQLDFSQESWDAFLDYIIADKLLTFPQYSKSWPTLIYLAAIATTLKQEALFEHCTWINFALCSKDVIAETLAEALRAAGRVLTSVGNMKMVKKKQLPDIDDIANELMQAIVKNNKQFDSPEKLSLLKGALPPSYADRLKEMLKATPQPETTTSYERQRARNLPPLLGGLSKAMESILAQSKKGVWTAQDADMYLQVTQKGETVLIPCHLFVLYSRWAYIRPMVDHGFKEMKERQLPLMKPNGELFEASWVIQFLRYLYTGQTTMLSNKSFISTTYENADYLALNLPVVPGEPDHSLFMRMVDSAYGYSFSRANLDHQAAEPSNVEVKPTSEGAKELGE